MTLLTLAWEFFKTGLLATGGGLATLPFLQQMSVSHPEWFSLEMLADMVAVSESTPGPLGVNMATYVGYTVGGVAGALVATFALVLPSILVILIIAAFLKHYMNSPLVQRVFAALRPAVTGLIAAAGYAVIKLAARWSGVRWRCLCWCSPRRNGKSCPGSTRLSISASAPSQAWRWVCKGKHIHKGGMFSDEDTRRYRLHWRRRPCD